MNDQECARLRASPAFIELQRKRNALGFSMAAVILVIYFGFVGLVAFAPGVLAMKVSSVVTLGFPLGVVVILSAILLTGIYVLRANSEFDRLTRQIVAERR